MPHLLEVEEEEQREAEDQQRYEGLIDHEQALAVDPVRDDAGDGRKEQGQGPYTTTPATCRGLRVRS